MSQAIDSPVLSQLFTQGRHRNASVILLLQNMFPKGKYNTDINRNAQYVVLFRSPSDRKQIDIFAERTFAKDRKNFMSAYAKETAKHYGYILIDNQPKTTSKKQVVSEVFGECKSYPHISTQSEITQTTTDVQPKPSVTCKVECPLPKQCTATEMIPTIEMISATEMTPNHHRNDPHHRNDTGGHHRNDPRNIRNGIKGTRKTGQQFSACFLFIYIASFLRCVIYLLPHFILQ